MELFELEKERAIKEIIRQKKKDEIELFRTKLEPKSIDYSKVSVQASPKRDSQLNVIQKIIEMENDILLLDKELDIINDSICKLYDIFKSYHEEDKQIYIEKKLYRWSNAKISVQHGGISYRKIQKVVKVIREKVRCL